MIVHPIESLRTMSDASQETVHNFLRALQDVQAEAQLHRRTKKDLADKEAQNQQLAERCEKLQADLDQRNAFVQRIDEERQKLQADLTTTTQSIAGLQQTAVAHAALQQTYNQLLENYEITKRAHDALEKELGRHQSIVSKGRVMPSPKSTEDLRIWSDAITNRLYRWLAEIFNAQGMTTSNTPFGSDEFGQMIDHVVKSFIRREPLDPSVVNLNFAQISVKNLQPDTPVEYELILPRSLTEGQADSDAESSDTESSASASPIDPAAQPKKQKGKTRPAKLSGKQAVLFDPSEHRKPDLAFPSGSVIPSLFPPEVEDEPMIEMPQDEGSDSSSDIVSDPEAAMVRRLTSEHFTPKLNEVTLYPELRRKSEIADWKNHSHHFVTAKGLLELLLAGPWYAIVKYHRACRIPNDLIFNAQKGEEGRASGCHKWIEFHRAHMAFQRKYVLERWEQLWWLPIPEGDQLAAYSKEDQHVFTTYFKARQNRNKRINQHVQKVTGSLSLAINDGELNLAMTGDPGYQIWPQNRNNWVPTHRDLIFDMAKQAQKYPGSFYYVFDHFAHPFFFHRLDMVFPATTRKGLGELNDDTTWIGQHYKAKFGALMTDEVLKHYGLDSEVARVKITARWNHYMRQLLQPSGEHEVGGLVPQSMLSLLQKKNSLSILKNTRCLVYNHSTQMLQQAPMYVDQPLVGQEMDLDDSTTWDPPSIWKEQPIVPDQELQQITLEDPEIRAVDLQQNTNFCPPPTPTEVVDETEGSEGEEEKKEGEVVVYEEEEEDEGDDQEDEDQNVPPAAGTQQAPIVINVDTSPSQSSPKRQKTTGSTAL